MAMETMTWIKMFLFLVVVGVVISLMPGSTESMPTTVNLTFNITALSAAPTTCESWVPFWCAITDWGTALYNFIYSVLSFLWQGLLFIASLVVFFTGVTAVINGAILPSPFNYIVAMVIAFMWLFLALDLGSRVVGVVWGR